MGTKKKSAKAVKTTSPDRRRLVDQLSLAIQSAHKESGNDGFTTAQLVELALGVAVPDVSFLVVPRASVILQASQWGGR